jgi:hypothetical protein
MAGRLGELMEANEALAAKLARLEHLLSRNSGNSSSPPSRDDDPDKPAPPQNKRRERNPARGKQPGGPGSHLAWTDDPDERRDRFPEGRCDCGTDLAQARDLGVVDSRIHTPPGPGRVRGAMLPAFVQLAHLGDEALELVVVPLLELRVRRAAGPDLLREERQLDEQGCTDRCDATSVVLHLVGHRPDLGEDVRGGRVDQRVDLSQRRTGRVSKRAQLVAVVVLGTRPKHRPQRRRRTVPSRARAWATARRARALQGRPYGGRP